MYLRDFILPTGIEELVIKTTNILDGITINSNSLNSVELTSCNMESYKDIVVTNPLASLWFDGNTTNDSIIELSHFNFADSAFVLITSDDYISVKDVNISSFLSISVIGNFILEDGLYSEVCNEVVFMDDGKEHDISGIDKIIKRNGRICFFSGDIVFSAAHEIPLTMDDETLAALKVKNITFNWPEM